MIESLKIKNFKNLNGLEIPHLSQINLISGQNNVGKSTLLEAIAIYTNPSQIIEILSERDEFPLYKEENETERINQNTNAFSSLFTDRKDEVSENNIIEISDKENTLSIQFSYYSPKTDIEYIKKVITITRQNKTASILHLNSPIDSLNQRLGIDNDSNIITKRQAYINIITATFSFDNII